MAIIRCPYCHAIIDENDKYCNNCGTQLLFSEDESVEEEIPGEKIIEAEPDEEEKDYEIEEPGKATTKLLDANDGVEEKTVEPAEAPEGETGTKDIGELIEEEKPEAVRDAELEGHEDETEEVILVDEIAAQEAAAKAEEESGGKEVVADETAKPAAPKSASEEETRAYAIEPLEKEGRGDKTAAPTSPPAPAEKVRVTEPGTEAEPAKEGKPDTKGVRTGEIENVGAEEPAPAAAPKPMTFDTQELEGIGKTVELSKERLDKRMDIMAEKQKEEEPRKEAPKPAEPEKKTGTLPPWADRIRSSASVVEREDTRDLGRGFIKEEAAGLGDKHAQEGSGRDGTGEKPGQNAEEEIFPRRKPPDSGIGLPERVTQAALPFELAVRGEAEGEEVAEEEAFESAPAPAEPGLPKKEGLRPPIREEAEAEADFEKEAEEEEPRPPFRLAAFLKAKAFDVLFIGIFWLVALWVAARSMNATLFELLSVTSGSVFLLYAVFILIYFFLFKFFLGETLGDRLFKERE
jgi:RNA polymerase subunit RPABC4/transcription elongation factor Spt4